MNPSDPNKIAHLARRALSQKNYPLAKHYLCKLKKSPKVLRWLEEGDAQQAEHQRRLRELQTSVAKIDDVTDLSALRSEIRALRADYPWDPVTAKILASRVSGTRGRVKCHTQAADLPTPLAAVSQRKPVNTFFGVMIAMIAAAAGGWLLLVPSTEDSSKPSAEVQPVQNETTAETAPVAVAVAERDTSAATRSAPSIPKQSDTALPQRPLPDHFAQPLRPPLQSGQSFVPPKGLQRETAEASRLMICGKIGKIEAAQRVLFLTAAPEMIQLMHRLRGVTAKDRALWIDGAVRIETYRRDAMRGDSQSKLPSTAGPEEYPFEIIGPNRGSSQENEYVRSFLWDSDTLGCEKLKVGMHVLLEVAPRQPVAKGTYIVSVIAVASAEALEVPTGPIFGKPATDQGTRYAGIVAALDEVSQSFGLLKEGSSRPKLDQPTFTFDNRTIGGEELKNGAEVVLEIDAMNDSKANEREKWNQVYRVVAVTHRQFVVRPPPVRADSFDEAQAALLVARNRHRLGFDDAAWELLDDPPSAAAQEFEYTVESTSNVNIHQIGYYNFRTGSACGWLSSGKIHAAREMCQHALHQSLYLLPESHWFVRDAAQSLQTVDRLAELSADQREELWASRIGKQEVTEQALAGHFAASVVRMRDIVKSRSELFGESHPITAIAVSDLAFLEFKAGHVAAAAKLLTRAMSIRSESLGDQHPSLLANRLNLSSLLAALGQTAEAKRLAQQAATDIRRLYLELGHDRPVHERHKFSPTFARVVLNERSLNRQDFGNANLPASPSTRLIDLVKGKPVFVPPVIYSAGRDFAMYEGPGGRQTLPAVLAKLLPLDETEKVIGASELTTHFAGIFFLPPQAVQASENATRRAGPTKDAALVDQWIPKVYGAQPSDYLPTPPNIASRVDLESETDRILNSDVRFTRWSSLRVQMHDDNEYGGNVTAVAAGLSTPAEAYDKVVRLKGRHLILQRESRQLDRAKPQSWLTKMRSLSKSYGTIASQIPPDGELVRWRQSLAQLSDAHSLLETKLRNGCWVLSQGTGAAADLSNIDGDAVREALTAGTVLLDFVTHERVRGIEELIAAAEQVKQLTAMNQPVPEHLQEIVKLEANFGRHNDTQLGVFVVRKNAPVEFVSLGDVAWCEGIVERWRAVYVEKRATAAPEADPGAQLRRGLIDPLAELLTETQTLLISPCKPLTEFPFAALPGAASGSYLIEDYAVAYVPGAASLAQPNVAPSRSQSGLLAVGDVDYDAALTPEDQGSLRSTRMTKPFRVSRLPGTAREIEVARRVYAETFDDMPVVLTRGDATEDNFRQYAPGKHVLILATHGFSSPNLMVRTHLRSQFRTAYGNVMNNVFPVGVPKGELFERRVEMRPIPTEIMSSIALAGANQGSVVELDKIDLENPLLADGLLLAEEVADLPLRDAQLVVLSACETALRHPADFQSPEVNTSGLQRAFLIAGADAVVASLWSVNDKATEMLMAEFYRNLWQKQLPPMHALREAQLALLRLRGQQEGHLRGLDALDTDDRIIDVTATPNPASDRVVGRFAHERHVSDPFCWGAFTISVQAF